jgi:hypothetical protein
MKFGCGGCCGEDASNSSQLKKSAILKNRFTRKIVVFTNLFLSFAKPNYDFN